MDDVSIYLTVLFIGIGLTVVVGQILVRSGRPFLEDVFPHRETASSVTQLLVVLFHLIVLGIIALVASIDVTVGPPIQTIVVRIGLILLVLGVAYGGTLLLLTRLRARRREQLLTDEHNAQVERAQQAQAQQHGQSGVGTYPPPAQTYPSTAQTYPPAAPQTYPVSEPPSPGR
ncbi:MAG: hypothetical protein ABR608_12975 [Pseudonocardiaceae bacterium]